MLKTITIDTFDTEVTAAEGLVLIAGIRRGSGFKKQADIVEKISRRVHPWLEVFMVAQDSVRAFGEKFGISGNPYFIIFEDGSPKGRLLGSADKETMQSFLLQILPTYQGEKM